MSTLAERLYAQAQTFPVQAPNRIKTVTKLDNGNLRIEQHSGQHFEIAKGDEFFQAFAIWTILNPDAS
jgi:hypothetical protein